MKILSTFFLLQQKKEKRKSSNNFQFDFTKPLENDNKSDPFSKNPFEDLPGQSVDPGIPKSDTASSIAQLPIFKLLSSQEINFIINQLLKLNLVFPRPLTQISFLNRLQQSSPTDLTCSKLQIQCSI